MPDPIKIDASPFIPVLVQIVTKLLAIAGAFLVTHGLVTDDQLAGAIPAAAQEIVGALLALGATLYGAYRSKRNNDQKVAIVSSPETFVPSSVAVVKTADAPSSSLPAVLPFLLVLLSAGGIAGCSTVGNVQLNVNKAFYTAQVALRAAQSATLTTCTAPPERLVQSCGTAIDLLHEGAEAEAAGFTAQQAGNAADLQAAVTILIALPSQLAALGVLEAQ